MNVKITGKAVVITSTLDTAVIQKLARFKAEALQLLDDKGEPIYKIACDKIASIGKFGVAFNDTNEAGKACMTIMLPNEVKTAQRKEYVEDNYSMYLYNLQQMETDVQHAYDELNASFDAVGQHISVE